VEITGGDVTVENEAGSSYGGDVRITGGRAYSATTQSGVVQVITGGYVNGGQSGDNIWTFVNDGTLALPTGGHIGPSGGKGEGTTYAGANDHLVSLTSYYNSGLYSSCVTAYADGTLNITAYNDGGPNPAKIWTFANDGSLSLPGLMTLPVTTSTPAITTATGTVAVCDGIGWNGGGDGFEHLMIYINGVWTKVV
jgi:hypothetical protein